MFSYSILFFVLSCILYKTAHFVQKCFCTVIYFVQNCTFVQSHILYKTVPLYKNVILYKTVSFYKNVFLYKTMFLFKIIPLCSQIFCTNYSFVQKCSLDQNIPFVQSDILYKIFTLYKNIFCTKLSLCKNQLYGTRKDIHIPFEYTYVFVTLNKL